MIRNSGSIFEVDDKNRVSIREEALTLCPVLIGIDLKGLKWLVIVEDLYDSPVWKKPKVERERYAAKVLYGKDEYSPIIDGIVTEEQSRAVADLAYNSNAVTLDLYRSKIEVLQSNLYAENDVIAIDRIAKAIRTLQAMLNEEYDIFIKEKETIFLKGKKKLSWIEMKQRSMKQGKSI